MSIIATTLADSAGTSASSAMWGSATSEITRRFCCGRFDTYVKMLHRPAEKKWVYKQPPEPFPPCPSRGCFLGPSGSGKSTTLISMLLGPFKSVYDGVYVFSPSVEIDSSGTR